MQISGEDTQWSMTMGYKIIQVNPDTWRIEDGGVRFFLLAGTEKAMLIDSGMMVDNAKDIAAGLTDLPVSLLNTHADRDHIGSNEQFEEFYMHPAEEPVYRSSGGKGNILPVHGGDTIDLGQRELKIIDLPGHTPGSIAVLDVRNRVLVSGDPIQRHGRIFMFGPHREMETYIQSLERLKGSMDEFDEIWPSHADIPIGTDSIGMLADGAKAITAGKIAGTPEEMFGHKITAYDLGYTTILCDRED